MVEHFERHFLQHLQRFKSMRFECTDILNRISSFFLTSMLTCLECFRFSLSYFLSWVSSSPFIVSGPQKNIRWALWPIGDTNGPLGVNYTLYSKPPLACSEIRSIYSPIPNIKATECACVCANGKHRNLIQEFFKWGVAKVCSLKL